jgi:hypothetical protein
MTDYRAELQRLVKAYDDHGGRWPDDDVQALYQAVQKARAALAATEQKVSPQCVADGCLEEAARQEPGSPLQQLLSEAGGLLARWGRPAVEPVPEEGEWW